VSVYTHMYCAKCSLKTLARYLHFSVLGYKELNPSIHSLLYKYQVESYFLHLKKNKCKFLVSLGGTMKYILCEMGGACSTEREN
jgi:hypothetical protein